MVCLLASYSLEPTNIAKALEDPDWVAAMQEEMQHFINQKVWTLVPLPAGKIAIGTKWILKIKRIARGNTYDVKSALSHMEKLKKKCMSLSLKLRNLLPKACVSEWFKALYGLHQSPEPLSRFSLVQASSYFYDFSTKAVKEDFQVSVNLDRRLIQGSARSRLLWLNVFKQKPSMLLLAAAVTVNTAAKLYILFSLTGLVSAGSTVILLAYFCWIGPVLILLVGFGLGNLVLEYPAVVSNHAAGCSRPNAAGILMDQSPTIDGREERNHTPERQPVSERQPLPSPTIPETEWVVPNPVSPVTDWRLWPSVPVHSPIRVPTPEPESPPTPPLRPIFLRSPLVFGPET
ncbi:putative ribonuclease H-like domain-containing protein [Tanacetum coccineum]